MLACVTVSLAVQGSADAPFWEAATNLAYPVGDLILLGAIVSAVGLAGWRIDRLWGTLALAIVAMEAADLMYVTGAQGAMGPIADALAATGMVGLARAAALAPGARAGRRTTTGAGLFVPVGWGALALGVLALGVPLHFNAVALGLAAAALGVVLVRMALALSENHALLTASRVEATTDALTGLSNRRKLQLDLAAALHDEAPRALVLLDLNGFKAYNDTYGHVATCCSRSSAPRSRTQSTGAARPTAWGATSSASWRRWRPACTTSRPSAPQHSPRRWVLDHGGPRRRAPAGRGS